MAILLGHHLSRCGVAGSDQYLILHSHLVTSRTEFVRYLLDVLLTGLVAAGYAAHASRTDQHRLYVGARQRQRVLCYWRPIGHFVRDLVLVNHRFDDRKAIFFRVGIEQRYVFFSAALALQVYWK